MNEMLKNCWLARVLFALIDGVRAGFDRSVIGRICAFLRRQYASSGIRRWYERFLDGNNGVCNSAYGRLERWCGRMLQRIGAWASRIWKASLLRKFCLWCLRIWDASIPGRFCCRVGLTFKRFALLLFGLYLPIHYVMRNVDFLSRFASVWDELLFLCALVYVIYRTAAGKDRTADRVSSLGIVIWLFIALAFALMCINAPVRSIAVSGFRATVQYMLWFFVIIRLIDDDGDFLILSGAIAAVGLGMALHGVYQYIVAAPIPASWMSQTEMSVRSRAYSITGSPNILGCFLVLTAPFIVGLAYYLKNRWLQVFCWCCAGVMALALLVTFSKGAWLGAAVAVVFFAALQDRRLFFPIAAAIPCALLVPSVANRITYLFTSDYATASAVGGRTIRWQIGSQLMRENPVLGFGLGRFGGAVAMQNQILEQTEEFYYFYMDNYYLKIGVEMGYGGIAMFVLLMAVLLICGLRAVGYLKRSRSRLAPAAVGIYSGLMGVMAHCYFENIFEEPYMMALYWGMAASLVAAEAVARRRGSGQENPNLQEKGS